MHAKRELSDCAKLLALKLFDDYNNHISIKIFLESQKYWYLVDLDKLSLFSGLHCASFFGIAEIIASLVEVGGCDTNQKDCVGNTPLLWAAENGHEGVVKMLLERDEVNPNKPDNHGQTPLHPAVVNGHEGAVKLLLGRDDINPNKPDDRGYTPLDYATKYYHEHVIALLQSRVSATPSTA